jgi:hypothetical protein
MNIKPKPKTNTTTQIMQRIKKTKLTYSDANAINNKKQELEHFIQKHKIDSTSARNTPKTSPQAQSTQPTNLQKRQRKPKRRRHSHLYINT